MNMDQPLRHNEKVKKLHQETIHYKTQIQRLAWQLGYEGASAPGKPGYERCTNRITQRAYDTGFMFKQHELERAGREDAPGHSLPT